MYLFVSVYAILFSVLGRTIGCKTLSSALLKCVFSTAAGPADLSKCPISFFLESQVVFITAAAVKT